MHCLVKFHFDQALILTAHIKKNYHKVCNCWCYIVFSHKSYAHNLCMIMILNMLYFWQLHVVVHASLLIMIAICTCSYRFLLTLSACARVTAIICLSVCLPVTTLAATYLPNSSVIRFLMVFQMHDLCGFRRKRFICQFWCHLLILRFLTSPGQLW